MRAIRNAIIFFVVFFPIATAHAGSKQEELKRMRDEMLAPAMTILGEGNGSASAFNIYSRYRFVCPGEKATSEKPTRCAKGSPVREVHTYALTNFHVAERFLYLKFFTPPGMPEVPPIRLEEPLRMNAKVWSYGAKVNSGTSRTFSADIVAEDKLNDLALIRIDKGAGILEHTARLAPRGTMADFPEQAWVVGSALGLKPFLREGRFGQSHAPGDFVEITVETLMTTAHLFFGDSGGPLYRHSEARKRYEVIGVSRAFFSTPFLSFSISLESIYAFLKKSSYGFISEYHAHDDGGPTSVIRSKL